MPSVADVTTERIRLPHASKSQTSLNLIYLVTTERASSKHPEVLNTSKMIAWEGRRRDPALDTSRRAF